MNYWTELSVEYANQRNYLYSLFKVYPISPNIRRQLDETVWSGIEKKTIENKKEIYAC